LVVAADTEGEESDDGKAPAAPAAAVAAAAAVAPSSSGKSKADVVPIVPAHGEKCRNPGCFRSAFGNDELEACCGTCTTSNGMLHGPHCENNYWEQQAFAWRPVVVPTSAGNAAGPTSTGAPIMFSSESEKDSGSGSSNGSDSGSGSESDRGNETDDDDWRKDNHNIDPEDPRQTHHQGFLYDKSLRAKKAAKKAAKQVKNAAKAATGGQGGSARGAGGSAGGRQTLTAGDMESPHYLKRKADDDDEGGGASKKP
jgi:hypothetical protein